MRYWISRTPGEVEGPFDVETIKAMRDAGTIGETTQVCPEGSETWRMLEAEPELARTTPPTDHQQAKAISEGGPGVVELEDYSLERAFNTGWNVLRSNYGLLLGMTAVMVLMKLVGGCLESGLGALNPPPTPDPTGSTVGAISVGAGQRYTSWSGWASILFESMVFVPYLLGATLVVVRLLRGERVEFADSWAGFRSWGRVLLIQICWTLGFLAFALVFVVPFAVPAYLLQSRAAPGESVSAVLVILGVGAALALPCWIYLYIRLHFSMLAVIDPRCRRPSMAGAFRISWQATRGLGTVGSLLVLLVLCGLILLAGALLCLLPLVFLSWPYVTAVSAAAYGYLIPKRTDLEVPEAASA